MHLSTSKAMVFKMQQCAGGGAAEGAESTPKCLGLKPDHSKVPAHGQTMHTSQSVITLR